MFLKKVLSQIIFILVTLFILISIVLFLSLEKEKNEVIEDEKSEIKAQGHTFQIVTDQASQSLFNYSKDYSCWDELIEAISRGDKYWMDINVFASMPTFNIQTVMIYDKNYQLRFSESRSGNPEISNLPLSQNDIREIFRNKRLNHFFILTDSNKYLLELACASIQGTTDMARVLPPSGYFISARYWSKQYLDSFSDVLKGKVELREIGKEEIKTKSPFLITSTIDLKNWKGNKIASLKLYNESDRLKHTIESSNEDNVITAVFIFVIFIIIAVFLIMFIFSPLRKITLSLEKEDTRLIAEFHGKNNEFADLARLIISFFRQKKELIESRENLEIKVKERTSELAQKNEILLKEEEALKESYRKLHELTVHLQTIREEERAAISRDIHDDMGQVLTALNYELAMIAHEIRSAKESPDPSFILAEIEEMQNMIVSAIERIRKLIKELRTDILDNLGLINTIKWQVEEFEKRTHIKCSFKSDISEIQLDRNKTIAAFRILQEALTNVARHAKATDVEVSLYMKGDDFLMRINDNGSGFSDKSLDSTRSLGITGMKERASICMGQLEINSNIGAGTEITLYVPLVNQSFTG